MTGVVALAEGTDDNTAAGAGMDELAAADINAYVLNTGGGIAGKEDQISRLSLGGGHRGVIPVLIGGAMA